MLLDLDQIKDNFSKFSAKYNENTSIQLNSSKKLIEDSVKYLKIDNKSKVLDLGSGTGNIAKFAKEIANNANVTACDFSEKMLQHDTFSDHKICCDINELSFEHENFTHIYSSFCLQWLNEDQLKKLITNLYNICVSEGILCFALPVSTSFTEFKDVNELSGCNFRLVNLPNIKNIEKNIDDSGFSVLKSRVDSDKIKYKDAIDFLKKIKSYGANYNFKDEKNLTNSINRKKIKKISDILLKKYDNYITWDILYYYLIKK